MHDLLANANKDFTWGIIKAVVNAVFIGIGLAVYADQKDVVMMCFYMGLGGLPMAWKATMPTLADQVQEGVERAAGEHDGCGNLIVRLLVCFALGCIISPILLIFNIFKTIKASVTAAQLRKEIAEFVE